MVLHQISGDHSEFIALKVVPVVMLSSNGSF